MSLIRILRHLTNHPLNRKHKLAALARYVKWQVGARLVPGEVVVPWVNDARILASAAETGVTGNVYCGLHEFPDMAFLLHLLRKQDLFLDIGANIGSYTVLAAGAVGSRACCFEPVPSTFAKLCANVRINDASDRVVTNNMALGGSPGELYFTTDLNCTNHILAEGESTENSIKVKVSTVDEQIKQDPVLIKIDVEGYETSVIEGGHNTFNNPNLLAVIMELNGSGSRYGYDEGKLLKQMLDWGFKTYSYAPFERRLIGLENKNLDEGNTLFIRDLDAVEQRLKSAPKISLLGNVF